MTEKQEQKQLLDWVKIQYPNLLYTEDLGGIRLTIGQATQVKKSRARRGHPDLMFQKPFLDHKGNVLFCGLALEFKSTKSDSIVKKNGELKKSEHLQEQYDYIMELRKVKWFSCFAKGFEEAARIIKAYVDNDLDSFSDVAFNVFPLIAK